MECYFKKLIVWQKSMTLVKLVYRLTKTFPADERYVLTDQLRRAAVSIPSNIAEGSGRAGTKDYAHFLSIARGSLFETMTQIEIAESLGYIQHESEIDSLAHEIASMLTAILIKQGAVKQTYENSALELSPSPLDS